MKSLRTRLLVGSLLWTVGLVAAVNLLTLTLLTHRQNGPLVHLVAMSVVAAGLLVGGLSQLKSVLAPFRRLRAELGAIRAGKDHAIQGEFPAEVAPLVADLNALLEHRSRQVERALARAGDLAHGLKTPLAVIGQEAERLGAAGHNEEAAIIRQQVERLTRQIDVHLAQARAAASGATPGTRCQVLPSVEGLVRTLARLHVDRALSFEVEVSPAHSARVEREDLEEMLGNLMDNACKWARSKIHVASFEQQAAVVVVVDDDGPGIPEELREQVLRRGVRADETTPGSGIGLAIVGDLVELYGGGIALGASPLGGLRVELRLPTVPNES